MRAGKQERLARHGRFRDGSPDALVAFLAGKGIGLDLRPGAKGASPFNALVNAAYLDGMYLSYMEYGSPVRLDARPPRPDYGLALPVAGGFRMRLDGRTFDCGRDATTIAGPSSVQTTELSDACRRIGLSFSRDAVVRQLSVLAGEAVARDPVFEPEIDLARPPGRRLRRVLLFVLDEIEAVAPSELSRLWQRELEQVALTALLLDLRHSWSGRLHGAGSGAVPADVRRTIDYLQANLARPLSLADLTRAAGVSGSTLLRHFRSFTGKSPILYLRAERLARARDDLLRADGESVTEIAARWGFAHFGRFAAEYRRRFGERPSETRRRAR